MSPDRANELLQAGLWLQLSGDAEGARRLFERAIELAPDSPKARKLLELTPSVRTRPELVWETNPQFWPFLPFGIPPYQNPFLAPEAPTTKAEEPPSPPPARAHGQDEFEIAVSASDELLDEPLDEPLLQEVEEVPPPPPLEAMGFEGTTDPESQVQRLLDGARELTEFGDHTAALELIGQAQALAPENLDASLMREISERALLDVYEARLGLLETVPKVRVTPDEIVSLNLDQRSGFVLAQIDGSVTFEDLFSLSGMSRFETARILVQLIDQQVIDRPLDR